MVSPAASPSGAQDHQTVLTVESVATRAKYRIDSGGLTMRRWIAVLLVTMCALAAMAKKNTGMTTLKDLQPAGTTNTKDQKKQQYDFIFEASGHHYTCRTNPKTSVKATDFVVGSDVKYEIDGDKGKLKTTAGKDVKCTVVRVEGMATTQQTTTKQ
jgi:hypothetical protein